MLTICRLRPRIFRTFVSFFARTAEQPENIAGSQGADAAPPPLKAMPFQSPSYLEYMANPIPVEDDLMLTIGAFKAIFGFLAL
jgi:hypothetical protein